MRLTGILVGGALAVLIGRPLYHAYNAAKNTQFQFRAIRNLKYIGNFPVGRIMMDVIVEAINPTRSAASIDSASINVEDPRTGKLLAVINTTGDNAKIPAQGSSNLTIPINLETGYLVRTFGGAAVSSLIATGSFGAAQQALVNALPEIVSVKGTVRVNGIAIPVNTSIPVLA